MFMVYWTEIGDGGKTPRQQAFDSADMMGAMALMESLRARQRAGEGIGFVTMQSENPDAVGHPGVADPGPDYDWKKRRR